MTRLQVRSPPANPVPRTHTSFSAISTYQACPLKYRFKYIDELPEDTVVASLVLGGSIHRALQVHFEDLLAGRPPPTIDHLLEVFWDEWHMHDHQQIRFGKTEGIREVADLAARMLRAFQVSELARPSGTIIAVEEQLRGVVVAGVPEFLARLDLLVETDSELVLTDFKTARSAWSPDQVIDSAGQLVLYGELVRDFAPGKPLRLEFAVLTKGKLPEVAIHRVDGHQHQTARTKAIMQRVWRSIAAGNFFPTPSVLTCPSCPYRVACRAWKG